MKSGNRVQEIRRSAFEVLMRNDCIYGGRRYFVADYKKYPFQFYWDSCLQAIVVSLYDGKRAEEEIYTLLSTQFTDGCMPYLTCWGKARFPWNLFLRFSSWISDDGRANLSTQPMLSALATWEIYKRTGNISFLERVIPELAREADYIGVERNLLDDGLTVIVNVLEAGTNESPVYDSIMDLPRHRGTGPLMHLLFYIKLSRQMSRYRKVGFDLERIAELEDFLVEDMTSNSLFARSLLAMGDILNEIGDKRAASEYQRQAKALASRLEELCWSEEHSFFFTRYGTKRERKLVKVKTLSGVLPLFTGLISKDRAESLVRKHLLNDCEFYTPYPFSFVSLDEPAYRSKVFPSPYPSLWRTGTWVNMNWLIFMGLREYGYDDLAEEIASKSVRLVEMSGFREFYNSRTGKGYGGMNYGMSTLVADMLARV